jgi:hypothetical protein
MEWRVMSAGTTGFTDVVAGAGLAAGFFWSTIE